jgi:hypothetical protein
MKLFTERTSHWYSRTGEPCHTVPARSGELRPTNVRDARKLRLLPSVTNVLGVLNKPELAQWKMEQAVLAALTLPREQGEELDAFAHRVVEDSQGRMQSAMDFGTAFHAGRNGSPSLSKLTRRIRWRNGWAITGFGFRRIAYG